MAAISMGMAGSMAYSPPSSRAVRRRARGGGVRCAATAGGSLTDQYRTLRIQPDASEKEVKRAYRQLALQYHPDVCKGRDCGVQFHRISEAYDIVISSLRAAAEEEEEGQGQWQAPEWGPDADEPMRGMCDSSWDMWEEWMGWEGAGIRDYTSHINPYI